MAVVVWAAWTSTTSPPRTRRPRASPAHGLQPPSSPESDDLAEALIGTFTRDYVNGAELRNAETVLAQLAGWIDDYNTRVAFGARDAEPGRVPGGSSSKLRAVSRKTGSRPLTVSANPSCRVRRSSLVIG
jgi:hypothetical protein